MNGFTVTTLDLSMTSPETGNPVTANLYEVDGIARKLSISELVMVICLAQATEIEARIVSRMETLSEMTVNLESLTEAQAQLTALMLPKDLGGGKTRPALETLKDLDEWSKHPEWGSGPFSLNLRWYDEKGEAKDFNKITSYQQLATFLQGTAKVKLDAGITKITEVVQAVSSRIDELNTTNQQEMISLQSDTNKRDNRYELITNMLKSIGTVLLNVAGNFRRG